MLTPKQEVFARKIVEGMTQADAYRAAYSCKRMTDKTIWENASRLMADSKVTARIAELRQETITPKVMSAQKRREKLTNIAENSEDIDGNSQKIEENKSLIEANEEVAEEA